jgi:hypothetical protein
MIPPTVGSANLHFNMVDALQVAGGNVVTIAVDFEPNVIEGRELIIGRNPRTPILSSTNNDRPWRGADIRSGTESLGKK